MDPLLATTQAVVMRKRIGAALEADLKPESGSVKTA